METDSWGKLVDRLVKEGLLHSPRIVAAMRAVPRTKFLPEHMQAYSAEDTPLPIGFGQTVSAPHMVSIMNEALELEVGSKVLEVGAGCGWHAATIAEIIAPAGSPSSERGHVYTVEIVQELADFARKNIMKAGYGDRVTITYGDGSLGYPEQAPYDRILVTAAAPDIPKPLVEQLKPSGIMLIPAGNVSLFQNLLKITKTNGNRLKQENLGGVAFVPLTGQYGHKY